MYSARIAELLEPFLRASSDIAISSALCHSEPGRRLGEEPAVLSALQLQHISMYIDILSRWNARVNLTAIRDPEQIVTRHFGESLFAARHLFPRASSVPPVTAVVKDFARPLAPVGLAIDQRRVENETLADLGSGAGFPGIPIKLWAPHLTLTLIESNHKKTAFLREIIRALTLTDVNVFPGRAQEFLHPEAGQRSDFDVVTLRAVERFHNILPVAANLVSPGGRLALLIGASQLDAARSTLPAFAWNHPAPVPLSQSRILLVGHAPR
jgi:16S rRNA (guanine527-N7)-methyltransferase